MTLFSREAILRPVFCFRWYMRTLVFGMGYLLPVSGNSLREPVKKIEKNLLRDKKLLKKFFIIFTCTYHIYIYIINGIFTNMPLVFHLFNLKPTAQ